MNHTIVLIDDNFSIRQIVKIFLARISHKYALDLKVFTSDNGVEGLGFVFITTPSLVVIDTTLPKYSGREVLDFLVHNPKFHSDQTKVIVLHEGEQKNLNLPKNFSIINKNDRDSFKNFSELVFNILNISDPSHSDDLYNRLSRFVLRNSNKDDLLNKSIEQQPLFKRFFLRFKWTWLELSTSLVLTLIILLYGRADDENITQQDIDKRAFRTKYYPTLVVTFISLTIIFINLGLFFTSQFSLLKDVQLQSSALTTFTVDSTADTADFSTADDLCDTDDSVGDGPCTLRAAIQQANVTAGTDTINFNISGNGVHTLAPTTLYPEISTSMIIDGSTESDANCSTSEVKIELNGVGIGGGAPGLQINSGTNTAVTIKGLAIGNFNGPGIGMSGAGVGTINIVCNVIGLDADRVTIQPNLNGILIGDNTTATIGGTTAADRNIISGNSENGISIFNNGIATIRGNYIGTDGYGALDKGNVVGIQLNLGSATISNNVISYNTSGIKLHGEYLENIGPIDITNNIIGLNAGGDAAAGNETGIDLTTGDPTDGYWGDSDIEISGNTISTNQIAISNKNESFEGHAFEGIIINNNKIGVGIDYEIGGQAPLTVFGNDVGIISEAPTTITNNIISYNTDYGITVMSYSTISNNNFSNNALALHLDFDNNTFTNNTLTENTSSLSITGSDNEISGNTFCNSEDGKIIINNGNSNIFATNKFGIATDTSIAVLGSSIGNSFTLNAFAQSTAIPIDLGDDGPTANDAGDGDAGVNNLQNYPTNITLDGDQLNYNLDTTAGEYLVEFHIPSTDSCSTMISKVCSDTITHTGGSQQHSMNCADVLPTEGSFDIQALAAVEIALNSYGDTSEMSPIISLENPGPSNTPTPTSTPIPGATNTPVPTNTVVPLPSSTIAPTVVSSPAPTVFSTLAGTRTPVPTASDTPTVTPTPGSETSGSTPVPTLTPTPTRAAPMVTKVYSNNSTSYVPPKESLVNLPVVKSMSLSLANSVEDVPLFGSLLDNAIEFSGRIKPLTDNLSYLLSLQFIGSSIATSGVTAINLFSLSAPAIASTFAQPRLFYYALAWFWKRKSKLPWGIISDKYSHAPVAFARVTLVKDGQRIDSQTTDLQGKYGFMADKGEYQIFVTHPDYTDFSKEISVKYDGQTLAQDFELNSKAQEDFGSSLTWVFYHIRKFIKQNLFVINTIIFSTGFVYTVFAVANSLTVFNYIILSLYLLQIVLIMVFYFTASKKWGQVLDVSTGEVIPGAIVRLLNNERQLDVTITDLQGRYNFILEPGEYYLKVTAPGYIFPTDDTPNVVVNQAGEKLMKFSVEKTERLNIRLYMQKFSNVQVNRNAILSPFN